MCTSPEKCVRLLVVLGIVQSTLGLNAPLTAKSLTQIVSRAASIVDRPFNIAVTGDKYVGKSTIVNHLVRNERFQENATAAKIALSNSQKVSFLMFEKKSLRPV